ncbi:MAG: prepilin-type N-terminal cleavage/methylation domain-containing protein [Lachnospiraceae bacterium]|nr:prepilin-type N-terminal cleavage/methylation domain-containing protein [Lachnospiraceae bacterium]
MKKLNTNKGFSLVEIIIVIAIIAIIGGILAPQLIKYLEKSKVAADTQKCDAMHTALTFALADPNVISADDKSKDWVDKFSTPNASFRLDAGMFGGDWVNCEFSKAVTETLGYNPWTTNAKDQGFKSTSANPSTGLIPFVQVNESGTAFAVVLAWSDRYGEKQGENFLGEYSELEDSRVIFVK